MKINTEGANKAHSPNTRPGSPGNEELRTPIPDSTAEPLIAEPVDTPYTQERMLTEEKGTILEAEEAVPASTSVRRPGEADGPLFDPEEARELQSRWDQIQVAFVDEPRTAGERANDLVIETTKRLTDSFGSGRQKLENEWNQGGDVSTENLRGTLQRYRAFFKRLLAI